MQNTLSHASIVNLFDKVLKPANNSIVFIKTQVKSDDFKLDLNSFLFAKADGNYVELYLKENKANKVIKRITLKELESTLRPYPNILKTHRSYLVNLLHLQKVVGNAQGYTLRLNNYDEKIPVSRNMIKEFDAMVKKV
jgi:DNA-binding LytR/AlgR family response regulator